MKLQRFSTNLATIPSNYYPKPPYKGRGWYITFGNYFHEEGAAIFHINGRLRIPKRIVIFATTEEVAQNAVELISASACLVNEDCGNDPFYDGCRAYKPKKHRKSGILTGDFIPPDRTGEYHLACIVAARASMRKAYQYALYKYRLSQQIFYTYTHVLEPSEWKSEKFVFSLSEHHVRCAQAITLGYSVLEELGLEIRANQTNPSFIKGKWNPEVKQDLEQRLIKAGVNLSEKALWTIRDTPTRLERTRPIPIINKADWAYSKVRDGYIEVVDAIAHASWLRSKVSAHRLQSMSKSLNIYDVSNIQYISHRLLLEVLGLWRIHGYDDAFESEV